MPDLIHLIHYINQHIHLWLTYYSDMSKYPVYQLLQDHNINPSRRMFTLFDLSWDDHHGTSSRTGGLLLFCQGGVVDHSNNTPGPAALKLNTMKLAWSA
jgi:hypothetical protein